MNTESLGKMKLTHSTTWDVAVGRQGEFLAINRRSKEIHKRCGASDIKLLASQAGAPQTEWTYVMFFDDETAWAKCMGAMDTDAEWLELGREFSADPPARATRSNLYRDLL